MAISQCDLGVGVKPEVVAAIVAALMEFLETEETPRQKPYVLRKSHAWKALALQEGRLRIRLGR
jgi:NAD-dependent oxidoreductase involved in siderophore biosynthesis